jgi:hypothetical protein
MHLRFNGLGDLEVRPSDEMERAAFDFLLRNGAKLEINHDNNDNRIGFTVVRENSEIDRLKAQISALEMENYNLKNKGE